MAINWLNLPATGKRVWTSIALPANEGMVPANTGGVITGISNKSSITEVTAYHFVKWDNGQTGGYFMNQISSSQTFCIGTFATAAEFEKFILDQAAKVKAITRRGRYLEWQLILHDGSWVYRMGHLDQKLKAANIPFEVEKL